MEKFERRMVERPEKSVVIGSRNVIWLSMNAELTQMGRF